MKWKPNLFLRLAIGICLSMPSTGAAQTAPADPIVKENVTVKVAPHTYVIPDGNVGLVPNVGIIVGTRATLVIDPGLGKRNGEAVLREVAKVSKNTELFVASTHFHAEHTTGIMAFPSTAKYLSSTIQEEEFARAGAAQIKTFSGRSPMTAELLKDATLRKADITFERDYLLTWAACASACWSSAPPTLAATPGSSWKGTTSCSRETW